MGRRPQRYALTENGEAVSALIREVHKLRDERDAAITQARLNAETVADQQQELEWLQDKLSDITIEYEADRWVSLELLIAEPEKYGARLRCPNEGHDFDCNGDHDDWSRRTHTSQS